jgi:DNA-directed RNA polymerase subunit beta
VIQEASHDDEWEEDDDEPVRRPIGKLKWQQHDEKGSSVDVTAPIPVAATTEAAPEAPSPTTEPSQAKVEEKRNESKVASTEPRRWSGAKWVKRTLLFLPLVWIIVLAVGLVIGYSVMGNQPPGEVFNPDLWKHLYDLIYG